MDPWTIEWFVCRMDPDDVKHAKANGNAKAKVGDEMWRVPLAIGPIGPDHDHWAGYHLAGEPRDWNLAAAAPRLYQILKEIREYSTLSHATAAMIDEAFAKIEEAPE